MNSDTEKLLSLVDTTQMHEYQRNALRFSLSNPLSYQALDMGLGKTFIALKWAEAILHYKAIPGVLVITPLRAAYTTWPLEKEKWAPKLTHTIIHGTQKVRRLNERVDLFFMNWEGIPWLFENLKRYWKSTGRIPFRALVIDEASMLKSPRTKRFKTMRKLRDIFPKWSIFLSATPTPKSLLDLWSQYYILDGGKRLGTAYGRFQTTYFFQIDNQGFYWGLKDGAQREILDSIKDITYRLPAHDYVKMPKKIDNEIKLFLPTKIFKIYKELEKNFFIKFDDTSVEIRSRAALSMKLRQVIQGAIYTDKEGSYEILHKVKIDALKEIMETAAGQGILCAIQFRFELDMIQKAFPDTPYIAKGIPAKLATQHITNWNKGEIPLLVCHPASLSHGVNLQTGSHIILWLGVTWSPEQYTQLIGRLYRQGQTKTVIVHHLIMQGTVDTAILKSQQVRNANQSTVLQYLNEYRKEQGL